MIIPNGLNEMESVRVSYWIIIELDRNKTVKNFKKREWIMKKNYKMKNMETIAVFL